MKDTPVVHYKEEPSAAQYLKNGKMEKKEEKKKGEWGGAFREIFSEIRPAITEISLPVCQAITRSLGIKIKAQIRLS